MCPGRSMKSFLGVLLTVMTVSCVDSPSTATILEPVAGGMMLREGERGPYRVERLTRTFRVRVDERVKASIYFPIEAGTNARRDGPLAVVVQGGFVEAERYAWIAEHLATRGFVAVLAEHRSELALLEAQNSMGVLEAMARDEELATFVDERGVVIGHSLGAVTAARLWLDNPQAFSSLVMLAGVPAGGDDFAAREGGEARDRIVSITGARDGRITPESVAEGVRQMREGEAPVYGYVIEGMNHMQWTTGITSAELENDMAATIEDEVARQRGLVMIDLATGFLLDPEEGEALRDEGRWPEGVSVLEEEVR